MTEDFIANTAGFVGPLERLAQVAEAAAHAVGGLRDEIAALGEEMDAAVGDMSAAAGAERDVGEAAGQAAGGVEALAGQMDSLIGHAAAIEGALNEVKGTLNSMAAQATIDSAVMVAAMNRVSDAANSMAFHTAAAGAAGGRAGRIIGFGLLGGLAAAAGGWGTLIHWTIAGSAELLSVAIPAFVAAGGGAAVMAQGFSDAKTHLTAMYQAQEATANIFHKTTGDMLGLGHALQAAQNAADPHVFELLGAGINIAKTDAGAFVSRSSGCWTTSRRKSPPTCRARSARSCTACSAAGRKT